jgi:hypothetical protein
MIPVVLMLPLIPIDLQWSAPAECPSRDAVLEDAAHVLSQAPELRSHATARADITRDEWGQWHAALSVDADGAHSDRVLDAESCQAIAKAAALIVALAVERKEPAQPQPRPLPVPVQSPQPKASAHTQSPSQFVVALAGVVDWGLLPAAAPGGELALGWAYRALPFRVRAVAGASLFGDQTKYLSSPSLDGGRFTAVAASARGCASLVKDAFDVGLCFGVELDAMSAAGFGPTGAGFTPLPPRTATWPSALGSILASYSLSRHVAIVLRGEGVRPIVTTPTFGVADSSRGSIPLHEPAPGVRAAFGVETRFF